MNYKILIISLAVGGLISGCTTVDQKPNTPPTLSKFDQDDDHRIGGHQHRRYHEKRRQAYEDYWANNPPANSSVPSSDKKAD